MVTFGRIVAGMALAGAGFAVQALPAAAAPAHGGVAAGKSVGALVAYVRNGDVWVANGAAEKRLTTGGGTSRPRWSPDGKRIAFLKGGQLWTMGAGGEGQRRLTTRPAAGPSWSPDGKSLAFASLSCTGGPGVYRIAAAGAAVPEVLFPAECRGEELPQEQLPAARQAVSLTDRLRTDDAVAWSPDGKQIAFRGGECDSVYDSCLSIGTVGTGAERTVAAYGGGSLQTKGFAVVPGWRADGAKLTWTASQQGETRADDQPVHVVEYDTATGAKRNVGSALDREMAYADTTHGVVTGQYAGSSWVMVVGLADGSRTPFHQGSQPAVQPVR
jgi:TolB protein